MKQGKIWGETEEIFNNGIVSVNYLQIKAGRYCSEHRHRKKSNIFFVISGELKISIWRNVIGVVDETIIKRGESTTIEPDVYHQFSAMSDVSCLEIYEVKMTDEDIERRTAGGYLD